MGTFMFKRMLHQTKYQALLVWYQRLVQWQLFDRYSVAASVVSGNAMRSQMTKNN